MGSCYCTRQNIYDEATTKDLFKNRSLLIPCIMPLEINKIFVTASV